MSPPPSERAKGPPPPPDGLRSRKSSDEPAQRLSFEEPTSPMHRPVIENDDAPLDDVDDPRSPLTPKAPVRAVPAPVAIEPTMMVVRSCARGRLRVAGSRARRVLAQSPEFSLVAAVTATKVAPRVSLRRSGAAVAKRNHWKAVNGVVLRPPRARLEQPTWT